MTEPFHQAPDGPEVRSTLVKRKKKHPLLVLEEAIADHQ